MELQRFEFPSILKHSIQGLQNDTRWKIIEILVNIGEATLERLSEEVGINDHSALLLHLEGLVNSAVIERYEQVSSDKSQKITYDISPFGRNLVNGLLSTLVPPTKPTPPDSASKLGPKEISYLFHEAVLRYRSQEYVPALEILDKILENDPHFFNAFYLKGAINRQMGDLPKALSNYAKTVRISPDSPGAWNDLGALFYLYTFVDLNNSLYCFDRSLSLKTTNPDAWNNKGLALDRLNSYGEALRSFDEAIRQYESILSPSPNPWYNKGNTLDELAEYENAIESFRKALSLNPNDADAWNNMGIVYHKMKDFSKALECYRKALVIDPRHGASISNLNTLTESKKDQSDFEMKLKLVQCASR